MCPAEFVFLPQLCSALCFVIWRCFSAAVGASDSSAGTKMWGFMLSLSVVNLLLLLLSGCLTSNLFSLFFQLPHMCQGPVGSEEWDNKKHWPPGKQAWAAPLWSKSTGCCQHKTSSEVEFAKTWLACCLGAWCWSVLCVWSPGLVSAGDAAGAISVPEPRAHFGSSLLVLQYEFGELMWSPLICRVILNSLSPQSHTAQLWTTCGGIDIAYSFPLCICAVKEDSRGKKRSYS